MNDDDNDDDDVRLQPADEYLDDPATRAGLAAINQQRVEREADKHRDPDADPADKEEAERRHSAANYRVLPRPEGGKEDEVDPDEYSRKLKAEQAAAAARLDDRAREKKEDKQRKR